jgi:arsenite-transporting ATPase
MPELMESWIDALSKRRRALIDLNNNMDNVRLKSALQDASTDPILATLERRKDRLEQVRARMMQHNFTGFVLVLIPERLPIEESARAAETLREANVNVCGVVINRVLPDDLPGDFYQARRQQEQVYRDEIHRRFGAYPLTWIPQFPTDVYGLSNLERISSILAPGAS